MWEEREKKGGASWREKDSSENQDFLRLTKMTQAAMGTTCLSILNVLSEKSLPRNGYLDQPFLHRCGLRFTSLHAKISRTLQLFTNTEIERAKTITPELLREKGGIPVKDCVTMS